MTQRTSPTTFSKTRVQVAETPTYVQWHEGYSYFFEIKVPKEFTYFWATESYMHWSGSPDQWGQYDRKAIALRIWNEIQEDMKESKFRWTTPLREVWPWIVAGLRCYFDGYLDPQSADSLGGLLKWVPSERLNISSKLNNLGGQIIVANAGFTTKGGLT